MTNTATYGVSDLDSLDALRFSRPRDMISVHRFAERLHYSMDRLEELSHVPAGTALRNPFTRKLQEFMRYALEVVCQHFAQAGDLDEAIEWFKQEPLAKFDGKTPELLVSGGLHKSLLG